MDTKTFISVLDKRSNAAGPPPGDYTGSAMDRQIKKKKWPPRRILTYAGALALAGFILYVFLFTGRQTRLFVDADKLTIATVQTGAFQEFIPVTGAVAPIRTIYLDAIQGGRVEHRFVEEGSFVEIDTPILQLSNTNLQLEIMHREAELFQQINNLRSTRLQMEQYRLSLRRDLAELDFQIQQQQREHDRTAQLWEKRLVSEQDFENARDTYEYLIRRKALAMETHEQDSLFRQAQIEQLEASVSRMQANLDFVRDRLDNLVVRAPIAGQLTSVNAEIGELKSPGQRLGQVDVLDGFKVRAAIDEHYIMRIMNGQPGEFDLAGQTYALEISKIYPEVRDGRFEVDLEFVGAVPPDIRRGQTVRIRLELGDLSEALLLPRGGFYSRTGGNWVYVVDASGNAARRPIRLGRQNPQHFEVLDGLHPGDRVVVSSYDTFGDVEVLVLR